MDNYTVTFKFDGDFDLPDNPAKRDREVPGMVLDKLSNHEFDLVDFNLTQNYDEGYAEEYIADPYLHRCVLEVKIDLNIVELESREAIYDRCLEAMTQREIKMCRAYENDNKKLGMLQSIICFEMVG
jgi:hypothetical protein